MLYDLSYELIDNLNKVIDINYYPIEKTRTSNMRHRPVGLGVQGLADIFLQMKLSFDSEEARMINKQIFETIYFGAMNASHDSAVVDGHYSTFKGSPLSEGKFQFNLWGIEDNKLSGRWNWDGLR
jgi:ribonucleoside-diphosphate reductase alpha chain